MQQFLIKNHHKIDGKFKFSGQGCLNPNLFFSWIRIRICSIKNQ